MNLFYLDNDHTKNAEYHVDKHVVKMILESCQLMCTTFHLQNINAPYRKTHENHPTAVWVRQSEANFNWCLDYAIALNKEYSYRYGKSHKSIAVVKWIISNQHLLNFSKKELTPFALAMPDQYKTTDPIEAYRNYYNAEKKHIFNWKNRNTPSWIIH